MDIQDKDEILQNIEQVYQQPEIITQALDQVEVTLKWSDEGNTINREIKEASSKIVDEANDDGVLKNLQAELQKIGEKFKKTPHEVAEVFVQVSGDLDQVEAFFKGENVVLWTYLEDLALTKSPSTGEYQFLKKQKGEKQIEKRKQFLLKSE